MRIEAHVQHDHGWWIADFTVDGREYGTQARRLDQVPAQVADAAALMTGRPVDDFSVEVVLDDPVLAPSVESYKDAASAFTRAQEAAHAASRAAVEELRARGLTLREIALLMGVSWQRVQQLTKS